MRNKLLYILFFVFIFFDLGLFIYYYSPISREQKFLFPTPSFPTPTSLVNNANPTLQPDLINDNANAQIINPGSPNIELSRPIIFNANIDKNSAIEGLFIIKNKENASISGISIAIELVRDQERNSLEIIDRELLANTLSFKPYEKKEIKFKKLMPKGLNDGSYFLRINALDQTGLPLQFTAAILGNIAGDNNFLDINWRDSKVIKNAKEFQPLEGPSFAPYNSPKIALIVKNPHNYPISAYPWLVIYPRDQLPKVSAIADYQEKLIEFPAKKEVKLTFSLPGQARPESYLTYLRFIDEKKQLISSLQEFRFVVAGEGGKILNLKASAEQFFFKTTVKIKASLIGPADDSTSENISFQAQVLSSENKKILGSFSQKIDLTAKELSLDFPIQFSSKLLSSNAIEVKASLFGKNNNLLHAVSQKIPLEIEKSADYSFIILISLIFIVLLIIFTAIFVLRKKKILLLSKIQFFLLFLILIFTAFFLFLLFRFLLFSQSIVSADSLTCPKTTQADLQWYCRKMAAPEATIGSVSMYPNDLNRSASDLREGETVTLMGSGITKTTCDNASWKYTIKVEAGGGISGFTNPSRDAGGQWKTTGTTGSYGNYTAKITQNAIWNSVCYPDCKLDPPPQTIPYSIKRKIWTCDKGPWSCYDNYSSYSKGSNDYDDLATCQTNCIKPTNTPTPTPEPPEEPPIVTTTGEPPTPVPPTPVPPTPTFTPVPPTNTPTPTPEPYHASCEGTTTCKKVAGAGASECTPIGGSCSFGWGGWIPGLEQDCGLVTYSNFCLCNGPCCATANCGGYACDSKKTENRCMNKEPNDNYRPNIIFVKQPDDGVIIQTRNVKINWTYPENGMGCEKTNSWGFYDANGMTDGCTADYSKSRFVIKIISGPTGFSPTTIDNNISRTGLSDYTYNTINEIFKLNGQYQIKICPKNGVSEGDDSACSDVFNFTKYAFPQGRVRGELLQHPKEDASGDYQWCSQGIAADPKYLGIQLKPEYESLFMTFSPCSFDMGTPKDGQISKIKYLCSFDYNNIDYDIATTVAAPPDYLRQKIKLMISKPADDILYRDYYCIKNKSSTEPPKCKESFDNTDKCMNTDYTQPNADNVILTIGDQTGAALYSNFDRNDTASGFPSQLAGTYGTGCNTADPKTCSLIQRNDLNIAAELNTDADGETVYPFFKLKNASFTDKGVIYSEFPVDPVAFDNDDDKYTDTGKTGIYFIVDKASTSANRIGVVLSNGAPVLGALDPLVLTQRKIKNYAYSPNVYYKASAFIQYLKSRKNIKNISDLNDLEEGKINLWTGALPFSINSDVKFKNKKILFVVDGDVYFDAKDFLKNDSANTSTLIIARTIHFYKNDAPPQTFVNNASGIFFADTIDFGDSTTIGTDEPLKIIGSVISSNNIGKITRKRVGKNNIKKPLLFIIFNPKPYIDLLPLLSTPIYQWSELNPFSP